MARPNGCGSPPESIPTTLQIEPLITMKQVGLVLGLSERSVRRIIQAGDLPAIRVGGSPRIRSADLRAYLDGAPAYYPSGGKDE